MTKPRTQPSKKPRSPKKGSDGNSYIITTIEWAVAKLTDELGFYITLDKAMGREPNDILKREHKNACAAKDIIGAGKLIIKE